MYPVKRMAILLLSVLLLAACAGKTKENVFIRIDRDDRDFDHRRITCLS